MSKARNQWGGFLIELMISMTILGVGLLALGKFQGDLHTSNNLARVRSSALNLVREKIDLLRYESRNNYASLADGSDTPTAQQGDNTTYSRAWVITSSGSPSYKTATVTVSWTDQDGQSQSVSQATTFKEESISSLSVFIDSTATSSTTSVATSTTSTTSSTTTSILTDGSTTSTTSSTPDSTSTTTTTIDAGGATTTSSSSTTTSTTTTSSTTTTTSTPTYTVAITIAISDNSSLSLSMTGSGSGSCASPTVSGASTSATCTFTGVSSSWSGSVTLTSASKYVCSGTAHGGDTSYSFTLPSISVTGDKNCTYGTFEIKNSVNSCGSFTLAYSGC
ncbi:MAG: type II secretion system protein [Magnetococcales bacterium]|nr:type II secretion system protein [Magnetococcales bacterium]